MAKTIEERVQSLEITRAVVAGVALFFGLSGLYLWNKLSAAHTEVNRLRGEVAGLAQEVGAQQAAVARARESAVNAVQAAAPLAVAKALAAVGNPIRSGDRVALMMGRPGPKYYIGSDDANSDVDLGGPAKPRREGFGPDEYIWIHRRPPE
jgi:hypothetical protein